VDGEALNRFKEQQSVNTDEYQLLRGILVGYHDENMPHQSERNLKLLEGLLPTLAKGFGYDSIEALILEAAAQLREQNGDYPSYLALKTGMTVVPESSSIRSDFILDISSILESCLPDEPKDLLEKITEAFQDIDLDKILEDARAPIIFMNFVALKMLGEQEQTVDFVASVVKEHVSDPEIKNKIEELLQDPDAGLEDCIMWE